MVSSVRKSIGASQQEVLIVVGLLVAFYFGYQYLTIHQEPSKLINKDFKCQTIGGIPAFQNPKSLAQYLQLNSVSARFAAPETAMKNADERERITATMVDLNAFTPDTRLTERRNPLIVRIMDTYAAGNGVILLRVLVLNKTHKGETWYISADKINPLGNVTGFADKAAKMHRLGKDDIIEGIDDYLKKSK